MKDIRIGFVGVGARGTCLMNDVVLPQGEKVVAVCDVYLDRAEHAADLVEKAGQPRPAIYTDYKELIADENVNVVVNATAWEAHVPICIDSMRAGKVIAVEVGGAYTLKQCYDLIAAYEETGTPFMFLENCCFGRREMMTLNMVRQGLFGEIVHCEGGYKHDLRKEVAFGKENRHYRLRNYLTRNCENYPTHELGPIARVLNINHGNRIMTLSSTASKAAGMRDYIKEVKPDDERLNNVQFALGDIVTTVLTCANGETIVLSLDTTLPRYYSRGFTVRGTKAMYEEATDSIFMDSMHKKADHFNWRNAHLGNAAEFAKDYEHPVWKEYLEEGVQAGHDGMDWLEFKTFFAALRNDEPMPIDVYDAATWMAVTALSEISISRGGAVVEFPDFTEGKWHLERYTDI